MATAIVRRTTGAHTRRTHPINAEKHQQQEQHNNGAANKPEGRSWDPECGLGVEVGPAREQTEVQMWTRARRRSGGEGCRTGSRGSECRGVKIEVIGETRVSKRTHLSWRAAAPGSGAPEEAGRVPPSQALSGSKNEKSAQPVPRQDYCYKKKTLQATGALTTARTNPLQPDSVTISIQ
ncbi:hypothetical protein NDU88_003935 [Pleurodeles waltl]|uniref:Uncharacterized protein n=1 Tax=Pleurodeles waltl TaxID=8319 RepID=A0AAV7NMZ6_PLEWA|nr:hypothetical protein NDU88_003935 [Pleurodeles waltl]